MASHQFIASNPQATFIYYPSSRDPEGRDNVAILNVALLVKLLQSKVEGL
jgi:hypothetical protein